MTEDNVRRVVLAEAKWSFAARRVRRDEAFGLCRTTSRARSGDLLLARVQSIGAHKRLQLEAGRPSALYLDDLVVVVCGDRYAPDQFEGIARLGRNSADLLASGGVAGEMRMRNGRVGSPTKLTPLGLLLDQRDRVLNVARYAAPQVDAGVVPPTVAVVGASMNSGKTTAVASLANGLRRAGYRVATLKATGTAAFGDYNTYLDAGAHFVSDFVDTGLVSTYRQPIAHLEGAFAHLLGLAGARGCDVALVEFADGVLQGETAALLRSESVRGRLDGYLFAGPDALSAAGACRTLGEIGIRPLAITGLLTQSPLAAAEAEAATGLPVWTREALQDPALATALVAPLLHGRPLCGEAA